MDAITTLKMFRTIGLMGSAVMPQSLLSFYSGLSVVTMDFEFALPGCGETSSEFVEMYKWNLYLIVVVASPVLILLPLVILFYYVLENSVLPAVGLGRMPKFFIDVETGNFDQHRAIYWKTRFVFTFMHT